MQVDQRRKALTEVDFFTEYGEGNRYQIEEVIGKGSYGVVCSALDTHTGEKVAIKKINDIFEHVSDSTRILREIKLLRLLRHPDIVEIKHILLPPSRREFKDIYVVFELMESDLHQVIKANDDLTPEHYQFFLYQLLRGLKYIHTANVFHRDLKPKNILANADCKLKICDFGLARVAFNDTPTAIFWTDYVATRWYRAPELCGSFFSKYTPAIDIWSIGCIFSELLTGKPLFPGKNVVHQLDLMTDLLGSPLPEAIARVRNEKARRYLSSMRKKKLIPFSQKFPNADPLALRLLEKMLAFEPKDRPTAEEALADPYFRNIAKVEREPFAQPVTKMEFEFERRRVTKEDIRELIYREILEYHPKLLKEFLEGEESTNFMYPSAVDQFKKQFAYLEEHYGNGATVAPPERQHASLPRPSVFRSENTAHNSSDAVVEFSKCSIKEDDKSKPQYENGVAPVTKFPLQISQRAQGQSGGLCISPGGRFHSFSTEGKPPRKVTKGPRDLVLCRVFRQNTCCDFAQTYRALELVRRLASFGEASQECLHMWELLECSVCDPRIGVQSGPPLMCASFCDMILQDCSSAYFSIDPRNKVLSPCGLGDIICGKASEWASNGTELCRLAGFAVKQDVVSSHDVDEHYCYGGKASVESISGSWKASRSGLSLGDQSYGVLQDFHQWFRKLPVNEKVRWAIGGMVLTSGLLYMSKRKSYSQRQKQAAVLHMARKMEARINHQSSSMRR